MHCRMNTYRLSLFIPVLTAIALAGACASDDSNVTGASGAGAGGSTSHAGASGHAGSPAAAGGTSGTAGKSGTGGGPSGTGGGPSGTGGAGGGAPGGTGGSAGADDGGNPGGASGDTGNPAYAGSGGEAGSSGEALQSFAYIATFSNGLLPVSIDSATGKLSALPGSPINKPAQLYAVSVDAAQRFVYTAEQSTKKINTYAIGADGSLPAQPNSSTTILGRPTSLTLDGKGRFAYVASSDEDKSVYTFKIEPTTGALTASGEALKLEAASPAYVAADPSGKFVYLSQNGVFGLRGYRIDQTTGALSELQSSPYGLAQVFSGAIVFHPAGGFLFSAGMGLNAFAIDAASGALTLVEGSPFSTQVASDPSATNIAIEPRGKYLYATNFSNPPRVFGFAIDSLSGKLTPVPGEPIKGGSPYSVGVEPAGRFVFAGNDDGTTSAFSLQSSNGTLHEIEGSPFQIGGLQPEFAFATAH